MGNLPGAVESGVGSDLSDIPFGHGVTITPVFGDLIGERLSVEVIASKGHDLAVVHLTDHSHGGDGHDPGDILIRPCATLCPLPEKAIDGPAQRQRDRLWKAVVKFQK